MSLKPLKKRLEDMSKYARIRLDTIQQDYILSWLLVGIFSHQKLKSTMVFKGGTALKKGYFGHYRFSEDLDFSAYTNAPTGKVLNEAIDEACAYAEQQVKEYAPIKIIVERYEEKNPHPGEQEAFTIRTQFPWQKEPLTVVMIEISRDEKILLQPVMKFLMHGYGEPIEQQMMMYSLEEIILEKLRAILQNTKKLHERDWGRSRGRDYYDLWRIFTFFEADLSLKGIVPLLHEKCALKQVSFINAESFFDPRMIDYVSRTWDQWLGRLVPELPKCELVLDALKTKIEMLLEMSSIALV